MNIAPVARMSKPMERKIYHLEWYSVGPIEVLCMATPDESVPLYFDDFAEVAKLFRSINTTKQWSEVYSRMTKGNQCS